MLSALEKKIMKAARVAAIPLGLAGFLGGDEVSAQQRPDPSFDTPTELAEKPDDDLIVDVSAGISLPLVCQNLTAGYSFDCYSTLFRFRGGEKDRMYKIHGNFQDLEMNGEALLKVRQASGEMQSRLLDGFGFHAGALLNELSDLDKLDEDFGELNISLTLGGLYSTELDNYNFFSIASGPLLMISEYNPIGQSEGAHDSYRNIQAIIGEDTSPSRVNIGFYTVAEGGIERALFDKPLRFYGSAFYSRAENFEINARLRASWELVSETSIGNVGVFAEGYFNRTAWSRTFNFWQFSAGFMFNLNSILEKIQRGPFGPVR